MEEKGTKRGREREREGEGDKERDREKENEKWGSQGEIKEIQGKGYLEGKQREHRSIDR